jgi:signal transduction histidine kinase
MLALLLIPIISLLYFYAAGAIQDIRLGERQILGTAYLKNVTNVYVDVLAGQTPDPTEIFTLKNVPETIAVQKTNLRNDAQALAGQLSLKKINDPTLLWHLRNMTLDVATVADLALGEFRDQQLLALAVTAHLPELANQVKSASVEQRSEASQTEFAVLRSAAFHALSEAVKEDATGETANILNQLLSNFDEAAEQFDAALLAQDMSSLLAPTATIIDKINALSNQSLALLEAKIESRTHALKRQLALVIASICVASLFALGFAVHMFKATFRELDTVETAKETLELSEAHAVALALDLQTLNNEIASLNVELTQNFKILQKTQDDNIAKSRMAQLGALTAMVAHELRNPLGAIRTSSFTIDKLSRKAGMDFTKQSARISHAVDRCDATISQLLSYAASKEVDLAEVDVSNWLETFLTEQAQALPAWIELTFHNGATGVSAKLDAKRLGQSIANLLTNSTQAYTSQFKDSSIPTCRIDVSACRSEFGFSIIVWDNGPGIPIDKISLVKEPLFTTKSFGPGLGLAIADQVVRLHGGALTIESGEGKGTIVTIALPQNMIVHKRAA